MSSNCCSSILVVVYVFSQIVCWCGTPQWHAKDDTSTVAVQWVGRFTIPIDPERFFPHFGPLYLQLFVIAEMISSLTLIQLVYIVRRTCESLTNCTLSFYIGQKT